MPVFKHLKRLHGRVIGPDQGFSLPVHRGILSGIYCSSVTVPNSFIILYVFFIIMIDWVLGLFRLQEFKTFHLLFQSALHFLFFISYRQSNFRIRFPYRLFFVIVPTIIFNGFNYGIDVIYYQSFFNIFLTATTLRSIISAVSIFLIILIFR
jgi:hypothetical protein